MELPKFDREEADLETLTDKWLYFIKQARGLSKVPETMGRVPEIQQAFEIANQANLSPEELEDLEKREIYIHDMRGAITKARTEGMKQKAIEIARQLPDVLDEETISQKTGLSLAEIQKISMDTGQMTNDK